MWGRRIAYLVTLLGCLVFYGFYREWFSWFLLLAVVFLPWFSLLISLPAMLTVKADLRCPPKVRMDMPVRTALQLESKFPVPPVRCTIRLVNSLTGERFLGAPGEKIPTGHCGMMTISYPHMFVYDYLGLFRRRLHRQESCTVYITPKPVADKLAAQPGEQAVSQWKPKPGGGFSENYDLRLYRPGDDLHNIHWKMAAKTGKLIYREPMEPVRKGYVLTLSLHGSAAELDEKLGKMLWLSNTLLEKGIPHQVRCLTGKGVQTYTVSDEAAQEEVLHTLLSSPLAEAEAAPGAEDVLWQHRIGGGGNEAR